MPRFHVHRSIEINASPEKIFEVVADFETWTTWSPWLCADPDAQVKTTEDSSSVGSIYSWKGEVVGEGEIEHKQLEPGRSIQEEIRFVKPFRSQSRVRFEMESVGERTKITWHMDGSLPFFLFWMRSQMEIFIGMDYERGLKMLKEWIETGEVLSKTDIRGVESVGPLQMVGVRKISPVSRVGPSMESAFTDATERLGQNLPGDCEAISVYHKFDLKAQLFEYTSGFAFAESAGSVPEGMVSWSTPQVQALRVVHTGSYENLGNAWSAANQYARYKKLKLSKECGFEIYKNDPKETPPAELIAEIYLPLR